MVGLHRRCKLVVAQAHIMEAGDGMGERAAVKISELELEGPHRLPEEVGNLLAFDPVVGAYLVDEAIGAPIATLAVEEDWLTLPSRDDGEDSPVDITIPLIELPPDVGSDGRDVLHQGHRVLERFGIDPLVRISRERAIVFERGEDSGVDMPLVVKLEGAQRTVNVKVGENLVEHVLVNLHRGPRFSLYSLP